MRYHEEAEKLVVTPKMLSHSFVDFFSKSTKDGLARFRNLNDLGQITISDLLLPEEVIRLEQASLLEIEREELEVRFIRHLNHKVSKNEL